LIKINIDDLRVKLDQHTERIISGLRDRSRYPLNLKIFNEEFADGLTWFGYRLKKEQDLDSQFGRFEFEDQRPIMFKKSELMPSKVKRDETIVGLIPAEIDIGSKTIAIYKGILPQICKKGEQRSSYGETAKLDVNNILELHERICGIGPEVAQYKLEKDPTLLHIDFKEIRKRLRNKDRERDVMNLAEDIAIQYELDCDIEKYFKKIIELTVEVEVNYIQQVQRNTLKQ
jgi:chorismate mutase